MGIGHQVKAAMVVVVVLAAGTTLYAHPGQRDENGCHVCRSKCEQYGLAQGMRHCHDGKPEQPVALPPKDPVASKGAYVDRVLDGDTIEVRSGSERLTVRVHGIDCPESKHNRKCARDVDGCDWQIPWGRKAAERAAALLKHQTVSLECHGKCESGRFGRALRYVRLADGRDFGLLMIEEGFCADYGWKYPHPRGQAYHQAQDPPQKAKKGLWQENRWDR